jgi:predicted ABC-type ATPase
MNTKTLYILRSVSGAGKTTLAKVLLETLPDCIDYAADDYHTDFFGNYKFEVNKIGKAHRWCQHSVKYSMFCQISNIIVHNTSTSEKELKPYLTLAKDYGYKVVSLIVENRHGNSDVHNVPEDIKVNQEARLRDSIKLR